MNPIPPALIPLNKQLIKVLIRIIRIIQKNDSIAQCLLDAIHPNIRRTASEMITVGSTPNFLVNRF